MDSQNKSVEEAATLSLQNTPDNNLAKLNELTLQKFLDTYKSKDTYNLLGLEGGKWLIPKCNYKVFYNLLAKAIQSNKRKLYYVEYPLKGSNKVIIDADFDQTTSKRLYTKDTILTLLKLYEFEIRKHINIETEVIFIVSERDKPYNRLSKYKDGFHAISPHIRLPTKILEEIRTNVLEKVKDLFVNDKITNTKENIIDKAIICSNGWQPIGCYKPTKKPYEITYIYENGELNKPKNKIKGEDLGDFLYSMSIWNNEIYTEVQEDIINDSYESQSVTYSKEKILESLQELKIQNAKLSSNSRNTYDVDYDHSYNCPVSGEKHSKIKCYIYENDKKWLFLSCYSAKCSKKFKYLIKNVKINEEFFTDYNLGKLFVKLYGKNFIYQNQTLYYFDGDIWNYKTSTKHLNSLLSEDFYLYCSKLIINNTNEDERLKKLSNILNLQSRKRKPYIISEIKDNLTTSENIIFDTNDNMKSCLNFKNGLLELNKIKIVNNKLDFTDAFRKRNEDDYVTHVLNYDFLTEASSKVISKIDNIYSKINPDKTEKDFIYSWFAYCLTGITNQQVFLTSIGYSAQNGKSTQSKIHSRVVPLYSHKLDKRTFNMNYSKQHKQIIHFDSTPIRYVYIEELDQKQLDQSLLKDFVDGDKLNCEIMYGDSKNVDIQCKLNICSNVDPNFGNVDKGILRRGLMIKYNQRFLPKDKYEEELKSGKKNINLRINDIEELFESEEYKNAYLHLLLPFVVKFFNKEFTIPENIKNKFIETAEEYDTFKNIIDKYFTITDIEEDRIHKDEYIEIIRGEFEKNVSWTYILSETKRIGLTYNKDYKINKQKGVILGIQKNIDPRTL
jgi:hypothetical protein